MITNSVSGFKLSKNLCFGIPRRTDFQSRSSANHSPVIAWSTICRPCTDYAKGPTVSLVFERLMSLSPGYHPIVGLIPHTPQWEAGIQQDPPVSDPNPI